MKGLLIKDFQLMKMQKTFFIVIIAIAFGITVFSDDTTFMLGFLTFVIPMFAISTISYDDLENGNAFLFTLPVSRTVYVVEKYCFALLLGAGAWIFAVLLAIVSNLSKGSVFYTDTLLSSLIFLPVLLIIQAVTIPFQLKFGGEKGRIAIIASVGLLFIIALLTAKGADLFGIDIGAVINSLSSVSRNLLTAVILAAAFAALFISMKISVSVMNKKEF